MEQKYSSVEIPQSRKLTEKGLQYQIDMKVNSLKSKKTALTKTLRKTLLLRGKCSKVYERKQELSKAQVLGSELRICIMRSKKLPRVKKLFRLMPFGSKCTVNGEILKVM